jgi:hypothetical protein
MRMNNQLTYILIGGIGQLSLFLLYKTLKNPKVYYSLLILTVGIAILGFMNYERPSLQMENGNAASWMYLPLLFMIYYKILRLAFIKLFKNEPLMTGYMQFSWNQGEYRRLHLGDSMFTIGTLILPFLTTIIVFK